MYRNETLLAVLVKNRLLFVALYSVCELFFKVENMKYLVPAWTSHNIIMDSLL
jgi:hypothetical protein